MAVDTYALTSRVNFKEYAGITSTDDDTLIDSLIDRASDNIETFCSRQFMSRDHTEKHGGGSNSIILNNYPVTAIETISYGKSEAITFLSTIATDLRATVEIQDDKIILSRYDSTGTEVSSTVLFSSYATTSGIATQVNTLTGWSATKVKDALAIDLLRAGGVSCVDTNGSAYVSDPMESAYRLTEETGKIEIMTPSSEWRWGGSIDAVPTFPRDTEVVIRYTAGYATVPDDLEQVCIEITHKMYHERTHDPSLASESLGGYSYSKAVNTSVPDSIKETLLKWKRYL